MDFIDSLKVLLRQWRVLLIGMVVVGAAAAGALVAVPTNYQATGQLVLLLPPQSTGAATPTNPYLNLEPGLTVTASLIASTLSTKDAHRTLDAAGFESDYSIGLNPGAGPILEISAEDDDPVMAVRTRDEVIKRLQDELARIQLAVSAPQRQLINARTNSVPNVAEALPGSKIRALAAIGGVGGVLTLLIAFIRDRGRTRKVGEPPVLRAETSERPRETVDRPTDAPVELVSVPGSSQVPDDAAQTNGHSTGARPVPVGSSSVNWWDS